MKTVTLIIGEIEFLPTKDAEIKKIFGKLVLPNAEIAEQIGETIVNECGFDYVIDGSFDGLITYHCDSNKIETF